MEWYEYDDLPERLARAEELRQAIDAAIGDMDEHEFSRANIAARTLVEALKSAIQKRRAVMGQEADERAGMYEEHKRRAIEAARMWKDWHEMDNELRQLLEDDGGESPTR